MVMDSFIKGQVLAWGLHIGVRVSQAQTGRLLVQQEHEDSSC